jgi:hypothetical protein
MGVGNSVEWWTHLAQDKVQWHALMNTVEYVYYAMSHRNMTDGN